MKKLLWIIPLFALLLVFQVKPLHASVEACAVSDVAAISAVYPEAADLLADDNDKLCHDEPTCSDTDGGIDFFTQGTVSGTFYILGHPHDYSFTDFCMLCHDDRLVEFYCKDGHCGGEIPWFTTTTCELGCEDGACRENEIPEFGLIAGSIALAGAVAGFFLLRRRH
ncbi:MAG: hypothetical protein ABIJ21_09490 [Nanoarchaeota archaeon]